MYSSYAPFYVDLLLWAIYLLLVLAVGLIAWSTVRGLRLRKGQPATTNGVPTRIIAWASLLVLVLTLALTYLTGDATPLMSNGKPFDDAFLAARERYVHQYLHRADSAGCRGSGLWHVGGEP